MRWTAIDKMIAEYIEEGRVDIHHFLFVERFFAVLQQVIVDPQRWDHPGKLRHFPKVTFHGGRYGRGSGSIMMLVARQGQVRRNTINIISILMLLIIAILILHVNDNIQTAQGANRQSKNIDEAEGPVL